MGGDAEGEVGHQLAERVIKHWNRFHGGGGVLSRHQVCWCSRNIWTMLLDIRLDICCPVQGQELVSMIALGPCEKHSVADNVGSVMISVK